jgi:hypothetical protein
MGVALRAPFSSGLEMIEGGGQSLERHIEAFWQSHGVHG